MRRHLTILFLAVLMTGCATRSATTRETWRPNGRVIPPAGAMWLQHPIKGGFAPPVILLGEGEPVRILKNHLGFTRIQRSDLQIGWVARGTAQK